MRTKILLTLIILIILGIGIYFVVPSQNKKIINMKNIKGDKAENLIIRQPAVAGQFYPADSDELSEMTDNFLDKVPESEIKGSPKILIVPHAGYVFSGQTAAYGFKQLTGRKYDKVILLGNSHQEYFEGLVIDDSDVWQTSFGQVAVDKEVVEKLVAESNKIKINRNIHLTEHSLEVEVPFLQKILRSSFRLVPGLFGSDKNLDDLKLISQSLAKIIDEQTLVVISTDLSHYPSYEDAKVVDQKTIEAILALDVEKFLQTINELEAQGYTNLSTCACDWPAVALGMYLASDMNLTPELLNYTNSGDTPYGDRERVVGYTSIIFKTQNTINKIQDMDKLNKLNQDEQKVALKLARQTLENAFDKNAPIDEDYKNYGIFQEKRGVFVTLHKNGQLRGCLGLIEPPEVPLYKAIQEMSLSAAFNDTRFMPLTRDELDKVDIEISVLTVPKKIESVDEIEFGKHGVIVKKDRYQGVFLPQVATETGWSKEKFLSELCSQKAGLAENCWQDPNVEIYTFEAQVFEE